MSHSNEEILIDYLDNQLKGEDQVSAEKIIQDDASAAQELDSLRFSVELIREAGVLNEVKAARTTYAAGAKVIPMQKKENAVATRSFSTTMLRIAATVLLVVGVASIFKYANTNTSSVYDQNFNSFELSTSRGINNDGAIEKAYRNKDWNTVNNLFVTQKVKTAKSWFLAGMADMELKQFDKAILSFHEVMNLNKNSAQSLFQDESEYYLALSYLGANNTVDGVAILEKIRSDKDHLFYKKASAISGLDLKIIKAKQ